MLGATALLWYHQSPVYVFFIRYSSPNRPLWLCRLAFAAFNCVCWAYPTMVCMICMIGETSNAPDENEHKSKQRFSFLRFVCNRCRGSAFDSTACVRLDLRLRYTLRKAVGFSSMQGHALSSEIAEIFLSELCLAQKLKLYTLKNKAGSPKSSSFQ